MMYFWMKNLIYATHVDCKNHTRQIFWKHKVVRVLKGIIQEVQTLENYINLIEYDPKYYNKHCNVIML